MPRFTWWKQYISLTPRTHSRLSTISSEYNSIRNNTLAFTRPYSYSHTAKMPLVVPGINSEGGNNNTQSWMQKLMGKKITESGSSDGNNFAKSELPQKHRILGEDSMMTMDFNPDR